ncbi:gliding motility-associated ABC transporter permease subunit GldF [Patiriisocius marinus]|uniref:gliding motility-associated ABC transporter permease subunit GldF n=1 Tax=Patiriisocius marinus TaxID=1397112 RepID=UPI00232C13B7|nr:gliding motility-associated ABC transporter permease subunit GldF [Patiriisocius marinus]
MLALIKKELNTFFTSPIGYLVIGVFLLINGLFLWVFDGNFNVFNAGFADLNAYFELAPWILLFLIPAITMRSFSDELKMGTLELLLTKPISTLQLVLGKYVGAFLLVLIALIPTLLYIYTISSLKSEESIVDMGSIFGSYLGLFFLVASYTAIGVFTSALTSNQIVAFISAVLACFLLYYGFEAIAEIFNTSTNIAAIGLKHHYDSIARGVIDTRNLIYFISIAALFVALTSVQLKKSQS